MTRRNRFFIFVPLALLGGLTFIGIGGAIVMLLWNALLPSLFGWREITFWQGLGLLLLCRILFGGFGFRGGRRARGRRGWPRVSREERERLRQAMRERWGVERPTGGGAGA